jgi:NhaP-type Na+/H+ or K+/H+ antiporter
MDSSTIAIAAVLVLAYSMVSGLLERSIVSAPMAFLAMGWLFGPSGLGLFHGEVGQSGLHLLAEITLILVLFGDAANIDFRQLRNETASPVRMLLLGLPGIPFLVRAWLCTCYPASALSRLR